MIGSTRSTGLESSLKDQNTRSMQDKITRHKTDKVLTFKQQMNDKKFFTRRSSILQDNILFFLHVLIIEFNVKYN